MNKIVAAVCAAVLVISLQSGECFSSKTSENANTSSDEEILKPEEYVEFLPSRVNINEEKDSARNKDESLKRVVRQAYQGQTSIYPNLPSGPPYGLEPYPDHNNNPNTRPAYNNPSGPYGQNTPPNAWPSNGQPSYKPYGSSNFTQPGYPNSNGYTSNNFTHNPTGPYGQYPQQPQPSWPPNGQRPNYNNPYGSNSQGGQYNYTQPGYPISNGYRPSNFSHNTPGPYNGQTTPSSNSWQNPYPNNNGQIPYGNNNATTSYFGYKPNIYNNPSGRPPYHQPVPSSNNNSYPGYPSHTTPSSYPGYPGQKPSYYPSQSPSNNTGYHPVIYDDSTRRPGQGYNTTTWNGNTLNNTQGRPPFNSGQNPQYFNSYPGSTGQGQQNTTNSYNIQPQRPPYQNPNYGQYSPSSYPGQSPNSATFNLANSGYNPSIPNKPPYGSPYGNGPYGNNPNQFQYPNGTSHDPTKVAPQYFNSY